MKTGTSHSLVYRGNKIARCHRIKLRFRRGAGKPRLKKTSTFNFHQRRGLAHKSPTLTSQALHSVESLLIKVYNCRSEAI